MNKVMGIGTIYLMISGVMFSASNYLIHIFLARFLGAETYGLFGVLMSLYLINRAFLNTGITRSTSKFLAESKDYFAAIFSKAVKLQLMLAIIFALIYIVFSKQIAAILGDSSLVVYIKYLGLIVIPLSILSLYLNGFYNGLRLFKLQGIIRIIYSVLRLIFTISLVLLGFGLFGALTGYAIAIIVALVLAHSLLPRRKFVKDFAMKRVFWFAIPLTISALAFSLVKNVNVLFIKSMLGDNILVGLYTAAATISNIPYVIFLAIPLTLIPSISMAVAKNNMGLARRYVRLSLRYLILLIFPITAVLASTGSEIITLLFSESYRAAGPVFEILIVSSTLLTIFTTLSAILVGKGHPKIETKMMITLLVFLTVGNVLLIPIFGIIGAAYAFLLAISVSVIIAGWWVYKYFDVLISLKSLMRITFISLIVYFVGYYWHFSGFLLLINYAVLFTIYVTLLFISGEINHEDLKFFKKIIFRT